ncbi:hypothetical protein V6Z12_A10G253100 [Gossypium hirsutum]
MNSPGLQRMTISAVGSLLNPDFDEMKGKRRPTRKISLHFSEFSSAKTPWKGFFKLVLHIFITSTEHGAVRWRSGMGLGWSTETRVRGCWRVRRPGPGFGCGARERTLGFRLF